MLRIFFLLTVSFPVFLFSSADNNKISVAPGSPVHVDWSGLTGLGSPLRLNPCEIINKGLPIDLFFRDWILPEGEGPMVGAWLRELLASFKPEEKVVNSMLMEACALSNTSFNMIEVLLEQGADPCVGLKKPLLMVFDQFTQSEGLDETASKKLIAMLNIMKGCGWIIKKKDEDYLAATQRYMQKKAYHIDHIEYVCKMLGKFSAQHEGKLIQYPSVWLEICKVISPNEVEKERQFILKNPEAVPLHDPSSYDAFMFSCVKGKRIRFLNN